MRLQSIIFLLKTAGGLWAWAAVWMSGEEEGTWTANPFLANQPLCQKQRRVVVNYLRMMSNVLSTV